MLENFSSFLSLIGALLTVVIILFLAFFFSRMLGKTWNRASSGRNLKIIEQLSLGPDRQILLLKVQNEVYMVGVSQAGIQILAKLEGEISEEDTSGSEPAGFKELFEKFSSQQRKKEGKYRG